MLTKDLLLKALKDETFGYYAYSSEDTFELFRSETTRYCIVRVPHEFVSSLEAFAAHSYRRAFDDPTEKDIPYIEVTAADGEAIEKHLRWIDTTDRPAALKFKEIALRGLETIEYAVRISGREPCIDLIVAKTPEFYVQLLWFTTG